MTGETGMSFSCCQLTRWRN